MTIDKYAWYMSTSSGGTPLLTRHLIAGSVWLSYKERGAITGGLFTRFRCRQIP